MMQPLFRRNRDISAVLRFLPLVLVVIAVFLTFSVQDSDAETTDDADPVYGATTLVVTLDGNGGTLGQPTVTANVTVGSDSISLSLSDWFDSRTYRSGYELAGWYVGDPYDPVGFVLPEEDGDNGYTFPTTNLDDIRIWYAAWVEEGDLYDLMGQQGTVTVPYGSFVMARSFSFDESRSDVGTLMVQQYTAVFANAVLVYGYVQSMETINLMGTGFLGTSLTITIEPVPVTVEFVSNGVVLETVVVDMGGTAVAPGDPEMYGYVFRGWFTSDGVEFSTGMVIDSDMTFIARWDGILQFDTDPVSDGVVTAIEGQPGTVSFSATPSQDYSHVLWDFGDGHTSGDLYATHYYSESGTYTATLTVYNNHGSDVTTYTIEVPSEEPEGGIEWTSIVAVMIIALIAGALIARRFL